MTELELLDLTTGKPFSKRFYSDFLLEKFMNTLKYSKKLKLLSITKWR